MWQKYFLKVWGMRSVRASVAGESLWQMLKPRWIILVEGTIWLG